MNGGGMGDKRHCDDNDEGEGEDDDVGVGVASYMFASGSELEGSNHIYIIITITTITTTTNTLIIANANTNTNTRTSNSSMSRVTPSRKAPEKAAEKVNRASTRYKDLGPHPRDAAFAKEERVYMTAASLDGTEEFYLVPLAEVEQREAQGWKLWKCPKLPLDDEGKDKRRCNFPRDVISNDRPHEDYEFYFQPEIVDCIKRTADLLTGNPACHWSRTQVVTSSSHGHFLTIRIPEGIGLGWGDYDLFTE
ncbi:hypothetical protein CHU98_g9660 [Xylaria longipes]|nr:hypothetical protein CHU98_g9660 [Xylaria longipes]